MKTLIILIDFYGHPNLTTDKYNDSLRYSYLTEIISSSHIDRKQTSFYTNYIDPKDLRLQELKSMAVYNGFTWVDEIPKNIDQVIITGTNTSGCVFKKESLGAYFWTMKGYKTKIYLPMCAEYEHKGINDFERNILGVAQLYKHMRAYNCLGIEICKEFSDLELTVL
mgnify:CR=1 FL=1